MNIISGKFKGHKIIVSQKLPIRPTMNKIRESIFSIIRNNLLNTEVLDLYAGCGSLGLEAISEGAKSCDFIDRSFQAVKIIEKNVKKFGIENCVRVINCSAQSFISKNKSNKYDIIFIDPPYKSKVLNKLLTMIFNNQLLQKDGMIIVESYKKEKFDLQTDISIKDKIYGDTKISLIKYKNE